MESIRKWFYRPKRDDTSLLAQFFYANEALTAVACELDSFDGRQEPERCTTLVNQLRHCQDKVLTICNQIMDELIPDSRANRDFRVKFPDDVMQENLAGQLWFGAECLAAGSSIMNREVESSAMRPLAKALTKSLEIVRNLLREHALKGHMNLKEFFQMQNPLEPSLEKLIESLKIFDRLFADFELCYVAAMVPVKSTKEYEQQELVCVLFSETLQRALERGLLSQADVDNYEPALMFTIPRLAIVSGLLAPPGGPLCLNSADTISEMFRPFRNLLLKIRELLWTLNNRELYMLEKLLCSNEEPSAPISQSTKNACQQDLEEFVHNFYTDYPNCKDFIVDFYTVTKNTGSNMDEVANDAVEILEQENTRIEYLIERRLIDKPDREKRKEKKPKEIKSEHSRNCPHARTIISSDDRRLEDTNIQETSDGTQVEIVNNELAARLTASREQYEEPKQLESPGSSGSVSGCIESPRRNGNDGFMSPDISQILRTTSNIEIPQTQYLLNQVSHENNVTGETIHVENSLPDMDSKKLISEANKTLSSLLLEGECPNEISEQTDSGICTVISSENTSLYDKSPEEKKTFTNELNDSGENSGDGENSEDTCTYSPSTLPKDNNISDNSCMCDKTISLDNNQMDNTSQNNCNNDTTKNLPIISSNFNGTNEEFVGLAYGNGQISVCDSNQPTFQINYNENWENLNLNIETTDRTKEFWRDLKCKNCPSTSKNINKIGNNIERFAQERISTRKAKENKLRKRQRKFEKKIGKRVHEDMQRSLSCSVRGAHLSPSTESSRSNSTDRCLNPRLAHFGASLHPSQNTRQMPNFGSHSPQRSPRLCHFEPRIETTHRNQTFGHRSQANSSPQNRKLLDHRRSRSEQLAKMRKRDIDRRDHRYEHRPENENKRRSVVESTEELPNDGFGPRTDKSGLVTDSPPPGGTKKVLRIQNSRTDDTRVRITNSSSLVNPVVIARATTPSLELPLNKTTEVGSSSSCSSCCSDSSSETSEFQSDCQDDEEIALAMQAAEIANRNQIRAKFRSSEDLVHRLFVCIAGVADQLQTNFASDLRNILKCVFLMNSTQAESSDDNTTNGNQVTQSERLNSVDNINNGTDMEQPDLLQEEEDDLEETTTTTTTNERTSPITERGEECVERAPAWVPDNDAPRCMACQAGFTVVRRRHHCRNCGKVFCGRCSGNNVPLPRYGHTKPVRVCNRCFLYQVTPFTVSQVTTAS